jgi:hypothetical protein
MRKTPIGATALLLAAAMHAAFAQTAPGPAAKPAAPPAAAAAAPAKDVSPAALTAFSPTSNVAGNNLQLTGWGTRKRFGFQVYHAALYVQEKSANPADYLTLTKRERLVLRFARELDNEQFTRIMLAALKERVNMRETPTVVDSMQKFSELFSSVPLFKVGDEVHLTMLPGGRMEFSINGDTKGFNPITEPPLARGILSIFIGAKPIDDDLKHDMLEGGPKVAEATRPAAGGPRR